MRRPDRRSPSNTMTEPRVAARLSTADSAYIAGLVDGEGTITLVRKHKNENKQLALTISSTERPLLEFVLAATCVGKITGKRRYAAHHRPSYTYAVYNRQALQVLAQLEPYLLSYKKQRCLLALQRYTLVTPRNGKYTEEMHARRRTFEESFLALVP